MAFGEYGLQALERCWLDTKQIEAARVAIARHMKRHGKMWIRVFPHKSFTKKPLETRMGKGKGPLESWVAVIRPANVLFEVDGVTGGDGAGSRCGWRRPSCRSGRSSFPGTSSARTRRAAMKMSELKDMTLVELTAKSRDLRQEMFNLRLQQASAQLEKPARLRTLRRDIARIETRISQLRQQGGLRILYG